MFLAGFLTGSGFSLICIGAYAICKASGECSRYEEMYDDWYDDWYDVK